MNVVFIHGRAQQHLDPDKLQKSWEAALHRGFAGADLKDPGNYTVKFPYYGDLLDKLVQQVDAPLLTGVIPRGTLRPEDLEFRAALLRDIARGAGISDDEVLRHFQGDVRERGFLNEPWVQAILRALDKTPLGDASIDRFTRDVYAYLTFPGIREQLEAKVSGMLEDGPRIVIAHSLGTVVAYNLLAKASELVGVRLFVTLGSPLGIRTVCSRLKKPLAIPACAASWFNAFDTRDVVALFPLDTSNFPIFEGTIENFDQVKNHTENRHSIDGYLDDPVVARRIYDALTGR
jgi:pimeloyl-ACP methyl ester carboxylesterase